MTPFSLQYEAFEVAPHFVESEWKSKSNDENNGPREFILLSFALSPMLLFLISFLFFLHLTAVAQNQTRFSIEILDDEALQIIDPETEIEVIGSGFAWTEGPLYVAEGDYLLFSDIPQNKIFKINSKGEKSEYLSPSGFLGENFTGKEPGSNALLLNSSDELVLLQHGERRVAIMIAPIDHPKPEYESMASSYHGKRFNSPNDGTFDRDGNLYFTDPIYGLPQGADDPMRELDYCGVYCVKKSGEVMLVDTLSRPNGIAISPSGKRLYVAVSDPQHAVWYQYDILEAGVVKNKKLFYNVTHLVGKEGHQGLPDGMKMHSKGYLFASGPGGIWIFNPEAKPIGRFHTGEKTSNCAFSDDEKTLYMTADDYVLKMRLK